MSIQELISEEIQHVPEQDPAAQPIEVSLDPDGELHLEPAPAVASPSQKVAKEMN